jgi:hypothetical protein
MTELQLIGVGAWSPRFGDWATFRDALRSGDWPDDVALKPDLIPPRERRRAPQLVKMAIEVMDQARRMAAIDADEIAIVFSSMMGDMQITDYMCTALAQETKLLSPTKFHNSVHNAAPGYWSITTGAFSPASAISAFQHTAPMALLEACIQAVEEDTPVLCVAEELAAPIALADTCPSQIACATALLLAPDGLSPAPLATLQIGVTDESAAWPATDGRLGALASNTSAPLLPILASLAASEATAFRLPISPGQCLDIRLEPCTT